MKQFYYQIHQAFNRVWEQAKNCSDLTVSTFNNELIYDHTPDKLAKYFNYEGRVLWIKELYKDGQMLLLQISIICSQVDNTRSCWYSRKHLLEKTLSDFLQYEQDLQNFRADVAGCQRFLIATGIYEITGYIETLSDLLRQLDTVEQRIITTVNRKLNEIGTTRIAMSGLILSVTAIIISLLNGKH